MMREIREKLSEKYWKHPDILKKEMEEYAKVKAEKAKLAKTSEKEVSTESNNDLIVANESANLKKIVSTPDDLNENLNAFRLE